MKRIYNQDSVFWKTGGNYFVAVARRFTLKQSRSQSSENRKYNQIRYVIDGFCLLRQERNMK